ncbi:3'(2'),5'-bisphosphate nucleotidase CysQ [Deltaproteobacteria bacterium]|nr:3'(2'),5'-bisphosphate nucleotidase CysQ [Deltaproteobacteria bacterium]
MNIDIELLKDIAREAGRAIMAIYGEDDFAVEMKADKSPLTAADKASHEVIVAGLQKNWPDIPILSEEGADIPYEVRKSWKRFWLVDPIDGTKEFIKRNGEFTVNIALIEAGSPTLGVVYVPAQQKLYWGISGKGAWAQQRSDQPQMIKVRQPDPEKGLTVVMSRSHPSPELEEYLKTIKVADALSIGSSLKLCVVAEGLADLYPRLGPTMEWDTAAGQAVVESAGGEVVDLNDVRLLYNKENLLNEIFIVRPSIID